MRKCHLSYAVQILTLATPTAEYWRLLGTFCDQRSALHAAAMAALYQGAKTRVVGPTGAAQNVKAS